MTSFLSLLPQSIVQSVISNHLKAGAVLRIFCDFTTPPKHKFVMVASVTPLQVFIILLKNYALHTLP